VIPVAATPGAKSKAVLATDRGVGDAEQDLLANEIPQLQLVARVRAIVGIVGVYLLLARLTLDRRGNVGHLKRGIHDNLGGLETTPARHAETGAHGSMDEDPGSISGQREVGVPLGPVGIHTGLLQAGAEKRRLQLPAHP
jgi:hypothetical protein